MDIHKRLQELENELIDFSCYEDQLNDKEELLNCFNKLKEAINYTRCCTELKGKEVISFDEWLRVNNYAKSNEAKYLDENANWFTEKQLLKIYNDIF
jgi:hypothetical protein